MNYNIILILNLKLNKNNFNKNCKKMNNSNNEKCRL